MRYTYDHDLTNVSRCLTCCAWKSSHASKIEASSQRSKLAEDEGEVNSQDYSKLLTTIVSNRAQAVHHQVYSEFFDVGWVELLGQVCV